MSERTVERYKKLVVEDNLAAEIMNDMTMALVEKLDLSVEVQRLDSTHIFSDMAQFGRTRMMGVAVKRFLTQLKRHDAAAFESLPESLRVRYQPSANLLFGDVKKDAESRRLNDRFPDPDLFVPLHATVSLATPRLASCRHINPHYLAFDW